MCNELSMIPITNNIYEYYGKTKILRRHLQSINACINNNIETDVDGPTIFGIVLTQEIIYIIIAAAAGLVCCLTICIFILLLCRKRSRNKNNIQIISTSQPRDSIPTTSTLDYTVNLGGEPISPIKAQSIKSSKLNSPNNIQGNPVMLDSIDTDAPLPDDETNETAGKTDVNNNGNDNVEMMSFNSKNNNENDQQYTNEGDIPTQENIGNVGNVGNVSFSNEY